MPSDVLKLKQERLTSSVEVPRDYYAILERRKKRSNSRPRYRTKTEEKRMKGKKKTGE